MKPHEIKHLAKGILSDKPSEMDEPDADDKPGKLQHLHIEPTDNGVMVRAQFHTGNSTSMHFDHEDPLVEHVRKTLKGHLSGSEPKNTPDLHHLQK